MEEFCETPAARFNPRSASTRVNPVPSIKLQLDVLDRSHDENSDLALKAFELSQTLREKWVNADYATKRRILEIVCLKRRLDDVSLAPTIRKPFDLLANDQSVLLTRGDRIRTCDLLDPNQTL